LNYDKVRMKLRDSLFTMVSTMRRTMDMLYKEIAKLAKLLGILN